MENSPLKTINFSVFSEDGHSVLLPGKLFLSDRGESNEYKFKSIQMKYPVQVASMSLCIICTGGSANIKINLEENNLIKGSSCVVLPGQFIQIVQTSEDFTGICMAIMSDFLDYHGDVKTSMKVLRKQIENPFTQINDNNLKELVCLYEMMKRKLSDKNFIYKEEVAKHYLSLMKYNMFQANIDEQKTKIQTKPATRKDEIFHMFIREVEKNYKMERNVTFYADKLCISPKYLSSVIHDVSGRYATEWIDGFVILESKAMLKSNGNTIKEICNKLNFANQSFFAKYFKQHTGLTPKEYRNKE
jgi:AraC-like DNA-binding protein